jgi:hypothetical protein
MWKIRNLCVHVDAIGRIVNVNEYKTFVHDDDNGRMANGIWW